MSHLKQINHITLARQFNARRQNKLNIDLITSIFKFFEKPRVGVMTVVLTCPDICVSRSRADSDDIGPLDRLKCNLN